MLAIFYKQNCEKSNLLFNYCFVLLFYNLHPNVTDQLFLRLKTKIKNQSRIGEVAKVGWILLSVLYCEKTLHVQ